MVLLSERHAWSLLVTFTMILASASGQTPPPGGDKPPAGTEAGDPWTKPVTAWLESDQTDDKLLEAAVEGLLVEASRGLAWLGGVLPACLEDRKPARSKGTIALATHAVLGFLKQQHECGYVFAGQYLPLQPMQPYAGDLLFEWLLDTPDWYPDTQRVRLVPALRDLQTSLPARHRVAKIVALVEDARNEPIALRRALACMLWQWGERRLAQQWLEDLQSRISEGDEQDRIDTLLELAQLQYELREYRSAAATHRTLQNLAKTAKHRLRPIDWYWSACVHALTQQIDRGIESLQQCAAVQSDRSTDTSLHLPKKLFLEDPEISLLRSDPRFEVILKMLFPPTNPAEPGQGR